MLYEYLNLKRNMFFVFMLSIRHPLPLVLVPTKGNPRFRVEAHQIV